MISTNSLFQLTAARRRLHGGGDAAEAEAGVSTHSRSKAAAVFTIKFNHIIYVSTHSRSKAAAASTPTPAPPIICFNSQPLEGGCSVKSGRRTAIAKFQLTAARRRLRQARGAGAAHYRFNSQPLEGGCDPVVITDAFKYPFQLTAARRRLQCTGDRQKMGVQFQLTAARRRLPQRFVRLETLDAVSTHSRSKAAA